MTTVQDLEAAIERWRAEGSNHWDGCVVETWGRDCHPGGHQAALDELDWGSGGILEAAEALEGNPPADASPLVKAAFAYRDAWQDWVVVFEAHKEHHRRYREARNFLHTDAGECDKCDKTDNLYEDVHKKRIEVAKDAFTNEY